jgi:hypothetical protein
MFVELTGGQVTDLTTTETPEMVRGGKIAFMSYDKHVVRRVGRSFNPRGFESA